MPLNPQVQRFLEMRAAMAGTPPTSAGERRDYARNLSLMQVEDRVIAGPGGSLPVRIYSPPGPRPLPVLVYYHGGGFVTGDLETHDFQCRMLARWAGCMLVHVNYRHAPEHPFPAAADDAYAGLCWVAEHAAELDADPSRIAVGGDSAGGNLAAVVCIMARDRGGPRLALQYLAYPVTDFLMESESIKSNGTGYGLTTDAMTWFRSQYVPEKAQWDNPLASPLRASTLAALPPALVLTAEFDPLRDEGEAYGRRLQEAGVPVRLKRYDGMVHGFMSQTPDVIRAREALGDVVEALKQAFARTD